MPIAQEISIGVPTEGRLCEIATDKAIERNKGCTHRGTGALGLYISMDQMGLSICGYTSLLR